MDTHYNKIAKKKIVYIVEESCLYSCLNNFLGKKDDLISSPISRGNDSVTVLWEKQISNAGDSSRRISKMPYKVEKFPKEVKKSLEVKRMCHGGTKHQRTTRTEHFTQGRTRLRTISSFGNQKFPEGGERPADGGQETTSSFREEGKVCKLTDSFRKEEKFFFQKRPNGQGQ